MNADVLGPRLCVPKTELPDIIQYTKSVILKPGDLKLDESFGIDCGDLVLQFGMYRSLVDLIVPSSSHRQSASEHGGRQWRPLRFSREVLAPDKQVFWVSHWRERCVTLYAPTTHVHASDKASVRRDTFIELV